MKPITPAALVAASVAAAACSSALAQPFDLSWNTLDGGGGTSTGGTFSLSGTIGQAEAGTILAGSFDLCGGYWDTNAAGVACYANCDNSTTAPILNVNDFICFQAKYAAGDSYANCDNSTTVPILNINDFICFQTKYAAGCP
jgi:hypothetical protein